jgi:hypothetical protein
MRASSEDRLFVAIVAKRLVGTHGLLMLGKVILGDPAEGKSRAATALGSLRKLIASRRLEALPVMTLAPDLVRGTETLVQCSGIGALRPNTVMFTWSQPGNDGDELAARIRAVATLGAVLRFTVLMRRQLRLAMTYPKEHWMFGGRGSYSLPKCSGIR